MSLKFRSPIGAPADTNELEYITALLQTQDIDDSDWLDSSIDAVDVKHFLMSRYGIVVSEEEVRNVIFNGLAGGNGTDVCLDLPEMVAILVIPRLLRSVQQNEDDRRKSKTAIVDNNEISQADRDVTTIIPDVLRIILGDVFGSDKPKPLTPEVLREIFTEYEELNLITDDSLVEEMIQMATGGGKPDDALLEIETFVRALTSDVMLYDTSKETQFSTHYDDVFGSGNDEVENSKIVTKETFPNVDIVTDTYRSVLQLTLSFIVFLLSMVSYGSLFAFSVNVCSSDTFSCAVSNGILAWLRKLAEITIIGVLFMGVLNLGNNPRSTNIWEIVVSLVGIILFIFIPASFEFDIGFFKNEGTCEGVVCVLWVGCRISLYILGSILVILQALNIGRILNLKAKKDENYSRNLFSIGETYVHDEFHNKLAAKYKVDKMINNAYSLHQSTCDDDKAATFATKLSTGNDASTNALALHNYTKKYKEFEEKGGIFWAWKTVFSRTLRQTEGLRLNAKLLIGNCILFSWPIIWVLVITYYWIQLADYIDPNYRSEANEIGCFSSFDPSKCFFPQVNDVYGGFAICEDVEFESENCLNDYFRAPTDVISTTVCGLFNKYSDYTPYALDPTFDACELNPIRVPKNELYSVTSEQGEYCAALINSCIPVDDTSIATCILGIGNNFVPFQFVDGGTCHAYDEISNLLETRVLQLLLDFGDDYIPRVWMLHFSLSIAVITSTIALIYVAIVTIPSAISTTLKFRSGFVASLSDPMFKTYRVNGHSTAHVIGVMTWSPLSMALPIFIVTGGIAFLCVWQVTWPVARHIIAFSISIAVTIALYTIAEYYLGRHNYAAFYRKRPLFSNFSTLALECFQIALSVFSAMVRISKLFVVLVLFIGRIDRSVLAKDLEIDYFPALFRQSLLAVEAHRHPYIARLGMMYMMKLRHGNRFGTRAGSTWRLLFVYALMPWLRKYRIQDCNDLNTNEIIAKLGSVTDRQNFADLEAENDYLKTRVVELESLIDPL